jgi:hypothetical protein
VVHTIGYINKAIKICNKRDKDLDNEQHRLDKQTEKGKKQGKIAKKQKQLNFRRQVVAKQEDILKDTRTYCSREIGHTFA